jgi:hypothetical protein
MGQIALQIPVTNNPNSTEDPKVASNFSTIQTWANGNVDLTNLAPGVGRLIWKTINAGYSAVNGDLINATVGGYTISLPTPTASRVVGIWAGTNIASPITVAGNGSNVFGLGLATAGAASFTLGAVGSFAMLQADGTNWIIIAGQQDTGWLALTLTTNVGTRAASATPAARLIGDRVFLRGAPQNNTGVTINQTTIFTAPAGLRPSTTVGFTTVGPPTATMTGGLMQTSGQAALIPSWVNADYFYLEGASYTLS